jgi:hypothetical protein
VHNLRLRTLQRLQQPDSTKAGEVQDAVQLVKTTTGAAARNPPSWEDRVRQLDADEADKQEAKPFWASHVAHVAILNDYVHSHPAGTGRFTDPITRELLGFEALVFGHQYLTLSLVSVVRLSNQKRLADRAQTALRPHPRPR